MAEYSFAGAGEEMAEQGVLRMDMDSDEGIGAPMMNAALSNVLRPAGGTTEPRVPARAVRVVAATRDTSTIRIPPLPAQTARDDGRDIPAIKKKEFSLWMGVSSMYNGSKYGMFVDERRTKASRKRSAMCDSIEEEAVIFNRATLRQRDAAAAQSILQELEAADALEIESYSLEEMSPIEVLRLWDQPERGVKLSGMAVAARDNVLTRIYSYVQMYRPDISLPTQHKRWMRAMVKNDTTRSILAQAIVQRIRFTKKLDPRLPTTTTSLAGEKSDVDDIVAQLNGFGVMDQIIARLGVKAPTATSTLDRPEFL